MECWRSDGVVVATGALVGNADNGTDAAAGHVRVYKFDDGTWAQLAADIDGEISGYLT